MDQRAIWNTLTALLSAMEATITAAEEREVSVVMAKPLAVVEE